MKKSILLCMVFVSSIISFSCNGDDDSSHQSNLEQKLIGTWERNLSGQDYYFKKKLTFRSDSTVDFYIMFSSSDEPYVGIWSLDNDILTLTFSDSSGLPIYVQKISFPNEDTLHFEEVPESGYGIVEDPFYRVE